MEANISWMSTMCHALEPCRFCTWHTSKYRDIYIHFTKRRSCFPEMLTFIDLSSGRVRIQTLCSRLKPFSVIPPSHLHRDLWVFHSSLYPARYLAQYLAYSRSSINSCWMKEGSPSLVLLGGPDGNEKSTFIITDFKLVSICSFCLLCVSVLLFCLFVWFGLSLHVFDSSNLGDKTPEDRIQSSLLKPI